MANANTTPTAAQMARVSIQGKHGTVLAIESDGWYLVRLDGETVAHLWHPDHIEVA